MISYKIVLVGDFGAGKTSLIKRYVDNTFSEEYKSSIGVSISKKILEVKIDDILYETTMMIWDIEGKTDFKPIFHHHLNGSKGFVIVADLTRQTTIDSIQEHIKLCKTICKDAPIVLALNKIDLYSNNIQIDSNIYNPKDIYNQAQFLQVALNQKDGNRINIEFEYPNLFINGSVISKKERIYVQNQFSMIKGLNKIDFDIKVIPPNIDEIIHFELNSSQISQNQEYKLINIINLLHRLDEDLVLQIVGFRDYAGSDKRNEILVKERALSVMKYLKLKGNVVQKLEDIGINEIPKDIDEENYPEQGRKVIFSWKN